MGSIIRKKAFAAITVWALVLSSFLCGCGPLPAEQPGTQPPTCIESSVTPEAQTQPQPQTQPAATVETIPPEPLDTDLVEMEQYLPHILVELRYAGEKNFAGRQVYTFGTAYLRYGTVKKLEAVCEDLQKMGYRLKVWDAFRPVTAQYRLWEVYPDPLFVADPTRGFSNHSRGNTLDVTLTTLAGNELEMPTDFDDFSYLADRNYDDCPEMNGQNALILQEVIERHGFTGYFSEWWHFTDCDSYEVEQEFDPMLPAVWYASCREYINLRQQPSTSAGAVLQIPADEPFLVLGWEGEFARAEYQGKQGYVLVSYIRSDQES